MTTLFKMATVPPTASTFPSAKSQGLEGTPPREVPVSLQVTTGPRGKEAGRAAREPGFVPEPGEYLPSSLYPVAGSGWRTHAVSQHCQAHVSEANGIKKARALSEEKTTTTFHECVDCCG